MNPENTQVEIPAFQLAEFIDTAEKRLNSVNVTGRIKQDSEFYYLEPLGRTGEIIRLAKSDVLNINAEDISSKVSGTQVVVGVSLDAMTLKMTVISAREAFQGTSRCQGRAKKGKPAAPNLRPFRQARIYAARWDGNRSLDIDGESFCTDGDAEDVCTCFEFSNGGFSDVAFARRISFVTSIKIRCDIQSSQANRTWVAVRNADCAPEGNAFSEWKLVQ